MEDKKSYLQKMADQLKEYDDKMEIEEIKKGPVPQVKTDENANTSPKIETGPINAGTGK